MFWEFPTPEPLLGSKVLEEKIGVFKAIKKKVATSCITVHCIGGWFSPFIQENICF